MKVLVCDYAGISAQWIEQYAIKENLEVVGTITPETDKKLLTENSWDYVLVFEGKSKSRKFFEELFQFMGIENSRVIYAVDENSWATHPSATYELLKKNGGQIAHRALTFDAAKNFHYFIAATTADGFHYVATSKDIFIIRQAYIKRRNWADTEMKIFHDLVKKFYDVDDSSGLFLDLGANIGTTGIYFTKKFAPNLKLLAFEPDPENFKLLRVNLILNDADENSVVENFGLGEVESEMELYHVIDNPGGSGVYSNLFAGQEDSPAETVKIISLDKYFAEKNLSAKDVKYIWIDTEGFEAQVLFGMKNILAENPAPIFMEFNPDLYKKAGVYDKWVEFLSQFYEGWIFIHDIFRNKEIELHRIEELLKFQNDKRMAGGDIFLIHKL
ncbi:MAG: FkbM family methyltransferase [Selenomonadaceae bacterium]|nr:FkbM family methyltransferase [Selenomonadaceae bacterium]